MSDGEDRAEVGYERDPDGSTISIAGRTVRCPHCGNDEFVEGYAQLNTAGMTLLGLDWANRSALTLICSLCRRVEWFDTDPDDV